MRKPCWQTEGILILAGETMEHEELITTIKNAAGIILAVTEKRNWIEVFFEGDLMHTQTVNFPSDSLFNIYVEEIPHKTTVYEHPRTMTLSPSRVICRSPGRATKSSSLEARRTKI